MDMINSSALSTTQAFGEVLRKLGGLYKNMVVLDADLSNAIKTDAFATDYPERHFNLGTAEANMINSATGFALRGKTVFACSYAVYVSGRCYEQIRHGVCLPNLNIKIIGANAGLMAGQDGAVNQSLEDISLMRGLPNMKVFSPCDFYQTKRILGKIVDDYGPTYIRLLSKKTPQIYDESYQFTIGKGHMMGEGKDIGFIATGATVHTCIDALNRLKEKSIYGRVIDMPSIKPIDRELIVQTARECKLLVTVEDHNIIGGLGSAVAEVLSEDHPRELLRIGVDNAFGESGKWQQVYHRFGIDGEGIARRAIEWWKGLGYY
ncbi:transketolase family protein [Patescibacteria group bacterium]|nr:transketolase family protein [Patescibacteria group bacterium]